MRWSGLPTATEGVNGRGEIQNGNFLTAQSLSHGATHSVMLLVARISNHLLLRAALKLNKTTSSLGCFFLLCLHFLWLLTRNCCLSVLHLGLQPSHCIPGTGTAGQADGGAPDLWNPRDIHCVCV